MAEPLFPYPRLQDDDVQWSSYEVAVDGVPTVIEDVSSKVDGLSRITVSLGVRVLKPTLREMNLAASSVLLGLVVKAPESNYSINAEAHLEQGEEETLFGRAAVGIHASDLAGELTFEGALLAVSSGGSALPMKLADMETQRADLVDRSRFPTLAYSFSKAGQPSIPWRLDMSSSNSDDDFSLSVRLHLNTDFSVVRDINAGRAGADAKSSLKKDIARGILLETARLADGLTETAFDDLIEDEPFSVLAGAEQTAEMFMRTSLRDALRLLRDDPSEFEVRLSDGTQYFRGDK
ncbi:hypothetical protein [Nesterenkonia populi]|uniref:hypothetical protein n=1 Tax=Nesterenkonia populi TaxID=1591087 RepID=UPI0011BD80B2|nr:hypothetical protein [Nesterenkonia populi]